MWAMNAFVRGLRYVLRQLRQDPGFTAIAVLTLAVGLAAVNTIFAVVETVLLGPLDFPRSDRVLVISQSNAALSSGPSVVTLREFQHWQSPACWKEPPRWIRRNSVSSDRNGPSGFPASAAGFPSCLQESF
jgi:hypothetical protein